MADGFIIIRSERGDVRIDVETVITGSGEVLRLRTSGAAAPGGGLTDAELRASPVPVSGPLTNAELRAAAVPTDPVDDAGRLLGVVTIGAPVAVTGPLTDAELRAVPVPVDVANIPHVVIDSMPPVSASSSADATVANPAYTEGVAEPLSQDLEGNLRVRAAALVSDTVESHVSGTVRPLSLTSDGRLRVATIDESFNFSPWGDPEKFGGYPGRGTLTAW